MGNATATPNEFDNYFITLKNVRMKHKQTNKSFRLKRLTLAALAATIVFSSCQKELSNQTIEQPEIRKATIQLPTMTNPFSLRNVEKAKETLASQNQSSLKTTSNSLTGNEPQFVYFKFNPNDLTTEQFQALENDTTLQFNYWKSHLRTWLSTVMNLR